MANSAAEDVAVNTGVKRKRKPSAKGLELEAEKGRKPPLSKLIKSMGKPSKAKVKLENVQDANDSVLDDAVTDEYI